MSPLPQPEQCSSLSTTASAADSISLLVKASTAIEDAGVSIEDADQSSSSSSSPHDETARLNSPLHQMAAEQVRLSPMQQRMSDAQQTNQAGRQQLDASILSRMVTASGQAAGMSNIRVASMQEFRHASRNSLESGSPDQMFHAANSSSRIASNPVRRSPDNPLLKMMEQRMAAKQQATTAAAVHKASPEAAATTKKVPSMVALTDEQKCALNASINKWSGIGTHVAAATTGLGQKCTSSSHLKTVDEKSTLKASAILEPEEVLRRLSNNSSGSHPRQPLDPSQEKLVRELIETQSPPSGNSRAGPTPPPQSPSPMQLGSPAQNFVAQMLLHQQQQQQQTQQHQQQNRDVGMYAPVSRRGIVRSAVSLAEIDRLRKANQSVQLRQQVAIQERISQQCLLQHQRKSSSGDVRVSTSGLPNAMSLRKRRSSTTLDEVTSGSSRTPSIASNTSSSKIHRSDSHTHVSGSMENLRLCSSRPSRLNMHNQRFSSSGINFSNQSFSSGLNIRNSSVSSGLSMHNQSFSNGFYSATGMRRASSKSAMKRNTSSSSWVQSMISSQESAGKAALVAATVNNSLQQHLIKPVEINAPTSPVKEEKDATLKAIASPVQVTTDDYPAPPIERGSSETVIISELPDRIKFQNVQIDKKPIDVVKEALLSRGEDANIKPTVDMPAYFFEQCEEMYAQEAVDAIRSSDLDALRQLAEAGKNLQCGNRFGETLIHLACRRSDKDVVAFLIKEAGVSIKVRDDFGRTPMHDACWRCTVDLDLMDLLIDSCPELLMLSDKRGHTPLDYARREHWEVLIPYLMGKKDKFRPIK